MGRKGGGLTKSKRFNFRKIGLKDPHIWGGGGGVRPSLEETQIKTDFFSSAIKL